MRRYPAAFIAAVAATVVGCASGTSTPASTDPPKAVAPARPARDDEERALNELDKTFWVIPTRDYDRPGFPVVGIELRTSSDRDGTAADERLAGVAGLLHLRKLKISSDLVTGSSLGRLAPLVHLEELVVDAAMLDDAGLRSLPPLPRLESVSIYSRRLTDDGWAELRRLPNLRKLRACRITPRGLERLAECPALTWLETDSRDTGDDELAAIARIERLEHVWLATDGRVTGDGLARLRSLANLRFLFLKAPTLTVDGLARLRPLPKLDQLELFGPNVDDAFATEIARWDRLSHVKLGLTQKLSDEGVGQLAKLPHLESFALEYAYGVTDHGMVAVGRMTQLRHLSLKGSSIGRDGIAKLARLRQLRSFEMNVDPESAASITDLGAIADLTELERLNLYNLPLTDSCIAILIRFKMLKELKVGGTKLTDAGYERLKRALPAAKVER